MGLRESDLPGIGRRYELDVRNRSRLVAVVHVGGRRDLFFFAPRESEPRCHAELDDDDARRLGAILAGSYFRPSVAEGIEEIMGRLTIDWVVVDESSPAAGKTILDLRVRTVTGMTVIGIVRGRSAITNPEPDTELRAGDRVVVVGPLGGMGDLADLVAG